MTSTKTKTLVYGLGGGAALIVITVVALWWRGSTDHTEQFNAMATAHKARQWPRAAPPKGASWLPGSAADLYKAAYTKAQDKGLEDEDDKKALGESIKSITLQKTEAAKPQNTQTPPQCVQDLGLPSDDAAGLHLTEGVCRWIVQMRPAMKEILEGSKRADAISPLGYWDPWSVEPDKPDQPRLMIPLIELTKAMLIDAYADGHRKAHGQQVAKIMAVARMGQDMGHGAGVLGTMLGVYMLDNALEVLRGELVNNTLPAELLGPLLLDLDQLERGHWSMHSAYQTEFFYIMPTLAPEEDLIQGPMESMTFQNPPNLFERLLYGNIANTCFTFWTRVLDGIDTPSYKARAAHHQKVADDFSNSLDPSAKIISLSHTASFDKGQTSARANLRMTLWMVAARLYQHQHGGQWPSASTATAELGKLLPGGPLSDPFEDDAPLEIVIKDGAITMTFPSHRNTDLYDPSHSSEAPRHARLSATLKP